MLKKINELWNKLSKTQKFLFVFIIITLFIQTANYFLYLSRPKQIVVPENNLIKSDFGEIKSKKVIVNTTPPKLPEKVSVLKTDTTNNIEAVAQNLANKLGLVQDNKFNWLWVDFDKRYELVLKKRQNQIIYSNLDVIENEDEINNNLDQNIAINEAIKFLNTTDLDNFFALDNSSIRGYKEGHELYDPKNNVGTNFFEINFLQIIEQYPTYFYEKPYHPLSIVLGKEYKIQKVIINSFPEKITKIGENQTISSEEIINSIRELKGTPITVYDGGPSVTDLRNFDEITIDKISYEYRYNPNTKLLILHYRASGIGTFENNKYDIELISPVVKNE